MGHLGAWAPGWNTNSFRYVDIYIYLGYVYLRYVGGTYDFGYAHYGVCIPNNVHIPKLFIYIPDMYAYN